MGGFVEPIKEAILGFCGESTENFCATVGMDLIEDTRRPLFRKFFEKARRLVETRGVEDARSGFVR